MLALAIETSCDDTSVAVLEFDQKNDFVNLVKSTKVLSSVVSSQVKIHAQYGGVVPEIGARLHATNFRTVLEEALIKAGFENKDEFWLNCNLLCVTNYPGLSSALKVGIENAKAIAWNVKQKYKKDLEIKYVNHLDGHIASAFLENENLLDNPFPHLHLLVSGGNTQILKIEKWGKSEIIGKTVDDAVGECLDKCARMLGFNYPGGVNLAKIAGLDDVNYQSLNRAMLNGSLNTSYSGLKTQVRYIAQASKIDGFVYEQLQSEENIKLLIETDLEKLNNESLKFIKSMCISMQSIAMEQLNRKMLLSLSTENYKTIGLSGGVSANLLLRKKIGELSDKTNFIPHLKYTGDNAAMIGMAGILNWQLTKK